MCGSDDGSRVELGERITLQGDDECESATSSADQEHNGLIQEMPLQGVVVLTECKDADQQLLPKRLVGKENCTELLGLRTPLAADRSFDHTRPSKEAQRAGDLGLSNVETVARNTKR